jgi:sulfur carrier protein ThiS adenylyltransferase
MRIRVNERDVEVEIGATVGTLRGRFKPAADVLIRNGAPTTPESALGEGDAIVLIRRGEVPSAEELEALMVARHTPGVHRRVKAASVGIAGLGGLGSAIAVALARIGVGRLVLVDFDVIEPSNLNRQQYYVDQIGLAKAVALVENLRRINPYVRCEAHELRLTPENVPTIFGDVDVLVEAFDRAEEKVMLLESYGGAYPGRPIVMASGLAGHGPSHSMGVKKIGRSIHIVGDLESAAQPGRGLMAPRVGIAAHIQANLTLRILLGEEA